MSSLRTRTYSALAAVLGVVIVLVVSTPRAVFAQQPAQPDWNDPTSAPADVLPMQAELARVRIDARVRRLVQQLDHAEYDQRQAATVQLQELDVDRKQFYALLNNEPLTIEQRHRIINIVRYRLVEAPRGALGISMMSGNIPGNPRNPGNGVRVTGLVPGMPAERVLQIDDRITHIDGRPIESSGQLVDLVQGKRPGDTIELTVMRQEQDENAAGDAATETMQVDLVLGSTRTIEEREAAGRGQLTRSDRREQEAEDVLRRFAPRPGRVPIEPWSPGS